MNLLPFYVEISFCTCCFFVIGGGEKAKKRVTSSGKLLPRERIGQLLDPG